MKHKTPYFSLQNILYAKAKYSDSITIVYSRGVLKI